MMIIRTLLNIYICALVLDSLFSYFPHLTKFKWRRKLKMLCDFTCEPIRKSLPPQLPFDFSPLLAILFINLFMFLW